MPCIIFIDMSNRLIDGINDLHRNNSVQILSPPVLFHRGNDLIADRHCSLIAADLHIMILQFFYNLRQSLRCDVPMDDKRLTCIAHTHSLGFRVFYNIRSHMHIRAVIHINMTISGSCLNHRNRTVLHHIRDKPCSAARYQNVNPAVHLHHFVYHFTARVLHKNNKVLTQFSLAKT